MLGLKCLLLETHGVSVTVLEVRDRTVGRVHTLDDVPVTEGGEQGFNELLANAREVGKSAPKFWRASARKVHS